MLPRYRSHNDAAPLIPQSSVLFIFANPGDELALAGGLLQRITAAHFIHITDGAPRDLRVAVDAGFVDRQDFAEARKHETAVAFEAAGLSETNVRRLNLVAGEASRHLATITLAVAAAIREIQPRTVVTHPCGGSDPDHNAIAFAVQAACDMVEGESELAPQRLEAAGHEEIATPARTPDFTVQLDPDALRLKKYALERMPIRLRALKEAQLHLERFRVAPHYDFTDTDSVLDYEKSGEALSAKRWRRMASEALRVLGLAVS